MPASTRASLRALVAQMLDDHGASRYQVIDAVRAELLDWSAHDRSDLPDALGEALLDHNTLLRPDFGFYAEVDPDASIVDDAAGAAEDEDEEEPPDSGGGDKDAGAAPGSPPAEVPGVSGPWRLLGMISPWGTHPLARTTSGSWTASPVERLAHLLRARRVPVGIVTDGRWWTLVWAPVGGTAASATWDSEVWSEEPETLAAFAALLGRARFLAVARNDTLPALLLESLERQEEITTTLGRQVREAVELLVFTLDSLDAEAGRSLLAGVSDDDLYDGVVTFMMRVVFLLFAEERRLVPGDDDTYVESYSVSRLVEQLEEYAAVAGEAALEHRTAAWHRLLAVSRAVHQGVAHEDLRLPAYGGGLFDPDRYPWLEGRTGVAGVDAVPPRVDDRTVLRMLRAVQYVEVAGQRRRLTFRALDVEQIGYVYEGLLELEVRTASEPMLLLQPARGKKPKESPVAPLSEWAAMCAEDFTAIEAEDWLVARTGVTAKRAGQVIDAKPTPEEGATLRRACGGEAELAELVSPLVGALRVRPDGLPGVALVNSRYVAPSLRRAATGTHYTPRSLAEDIADNALESLVYRPGPLETSDRGQWRLRPSTEILALRVADIAMGSGAFLVAACRYLADRLVDAWDAEGRADAQRALLGRRGRSLASDAEIDEVLLEARRLVAEHCLYGVDVNPLAVEMAKLSLWLITMDRERPFGFIDDRLRCGDSLLGVASVEQLETLHLDPVEGRRRHEGTLLDISHRIRPLLEQAADLRRRITAQPVTTVRDVEHKQRLLAEADALTSRLGGIADALTAEGLVSARARPSSQTTGFLAVADRVRTALESNNDADLCERAEADLQRGRPAGTTLRRPFHWPLLFPEVFADSREPGFDAIIGNPPFLGGQKIRAHHGADYRAWLQRWDGRAVKGSADLVAFFLLRAERLLSDRGQVAYLAVNTLVQGDTLQVGLLPACHRGLVLRRGRSSHKWPTRTVNLEIVELWATRAGLGPAVSCWLDGEDVPHIGPDLEPVGNVTGRPQPLRENADIAFQGSNVLGLGFTLTHEEADRLIGSDPRNRDAIQPYVIGRDLNQRPDCSASRWVINFRDWPLERCEDYPALIDIVRRRVKPERDRNRDRQRREIWWRFTRPAPELYEAIADLDHVLVSAQVSSTLMPVRVAATSVFGHKCVAFVSDDFGFLAFLSSDVHGAWVVRYASTMRTDISYGPSDVFVTLPRPESTKEMTELGERLDKERRELMVSRSWGLTTTYNHVHDPAERDPEVVNLREIHAEIDRAVFAAYGWGDLDPEIGHHPTKIGVRWTLSQAVRFEVLDRLLAENHRRYALENGLPSPSPAEDHRFGIRSAG